MSAEQASNSARVKLSFILTPPDSLKSLSEHLKAPGRTLVTALARREVFAAEGTLAVMTGHTTQRPRSRVMVQGLRRSHLSRLRHPRPDVMTIVAAEALVCRVPGVAEIDAEGPRRFRRADQATERVAGTAGRDIRAGWGL